MLTKEQEGGEPLGDDPAVPEVVEVEVHDEASGAGVGGAATNYLLDDPLEDDDDENNDNDDDD